MPCFDCKGWGEAKSRSYSAASDAGDDEEGLGAVGDAAGQRGVEGLEGDVLLTGEETQEVAAFAGGVVADGAAQGGILRFKGVNNSGNGNWRGEVQLDLVAGDMCELT